VGSPRVRLLFDIYHVQIEEGNVISLLRQCAGEIGYVHVADVPGRHEPGTGEINYPHIVRTLHEIGYNGVVGLEAFPIDGDEQAMERFREVFSR
jgi:hydroxypyruvate isomerase